MKCADQDVQELLKGVEFSMAKNGLEFEQLQLYASTTYKNGADVRKCLKQEKLATFMPRRMKRSTINKTPIENH